MARRPLKVPSHQIVTFRALKTPMGSSHQENRDVASRFFAFGRRLSRAKRHFRHKPAVCASGCTERNQPPAVTRFLCHNLCTDKSSQGAHPLRRTYGENRSKRGSVRILTARSLRFPPRGLGLIRKCIRSSSQTGPKVCKAMHIARRSSHRIYFTASQGLHG